MKRITSYLQVIALALWFTSVSMADIWTRKSDMPTAKYFSGTSVVNGTIYVIGGWDAWNDPTPFAAVEVYDPATDTWERKADMPTARGTLATAVLDGKIYAIGGARGSSPLSIVEVYDPITDTWGESARLSQARWFHSALVVNGRIYAIGGFGTPTIEEYDPERGTWAKITDLPFNLWVFGVGAVNGTIYIIGGWTGSPMSTVLSYHPGDDQWSQKADMPTARAALSATVVNGKIYAIGGGAYKGGPGLPTVEAYDPATDTWETAADMPTPRSELSVVTVNGRIYAIGGMTLFSPFSTVEAYEPYPLVVDFNGDWIVDGLDVSMMVEHWHTANPLFDIAPRPAGDGIVDIQDLTLLAEHLFEEVLPADLIAYWKLDESEGDIAYDSAGTHDAVAAGHPIWQPAGGQQDGALYFDGVDDGLIADFVLNPVDGPFSVFAWIKGGAPRQAILSQGNGTDWLTVNDHGSLETDISDPVRTFRNRAVGGAPLMSQAVITDGDWHRIGFAWDGADRVLYVDDAEVARETLSGLASHNGDLYLGTGMNLEPGTFWSGMIDDVQIYDRVVQP